MKPRILALGLLLAAGVAQAGYRYNYNVVVSDTYVSGPIGGARNSADTLQSIGCYSTASATHRYAVCSAQDATGRGKSCSTFDANLIQVAQSLTSDSVVAFGWDATGTCTYITAMTYSQYQPKQL